MRQDFLIDIVIMDNMQCQNDLKKDSPIVYYSDMSIKTKQNNYKVVYNFTQAWWAEMLLYTL